MFEIMLFEYSIIHYVLQYASNRKRKLIVPIIANDHEASEAYGGRNFSEEHYLTLCK